MSTSIPLMALCSLSYRYKKSGGHVLTHLLSGIGKHHLGNELETKPLAVICSRILARSRVCIRAHQTSSVLSVILPIEILPISIIRMKAETLSWSSGWLSFLHDLVHKTGTKIRISER